MNDQVPMTNVQSNPKSQALNHKYDLEERTTAFSENVIDFCKTLSQTTITRPLISQLVRSTTSISANYCEADEASSKKDFINKITIAKKETKETKHWLRLIAHTISDVAAESRTLWREAQELNLIFAAIVRSARKNRN